MSNLESLPYAADDFIAPSIPEDERVWVPQGDDIWFRPLHLNRTTGQWVNLLRVRRSGVLSRHRHPAPVHGLVLQGSWRYLEHDWEAKKGDYVYEPPGEVHTLVCTNPHEMISLFIVNGALIYLDDEGQTTGFDDVHTKTELCIRHYGSVGLGANYVEQFIR